MGHGNGLRRVTDGPRDPVDYYKTHAAQFDATRSRADVEQGWFDRFTALVPEGGDILDAGCGGGEPIATSLAKRGFRLTGFDAVPAFVEMASERLPDHEWLVADLREFDLGRPFDGAVAWDSFFHIAGDQQPQVLKRLVRHLKPGAPLLFNAGHDEGEAVNPMFGEPLYHASLTPARYRDLLEQAGCELVDWREQDPDCGHRTVYLARRETDRSSC